MFICKKCRKKKRNLTKEDNKCKKCGGISFTTAEMEKATKIINLILRK
jgi:hypothetical protein